MIDSLIAQFVETAVATKRQVINITLTKVLFILAGLVFVIGGLAFVLVAIYHALAPIHMTSLEAAAVIAVSLLVLGGAFVLIGIKGDFKPSADEKRDPRSAELAALEALGSLNRSLSDMSRNRGGATPYLGLLGIAALVGFISGRKR